MTFEQWWERSGKEQVRALYKLPIQSFSDIEYSMRVAALAGWEGAKLRQQSVFDDWWEMHESECTEYRYGKKCFELCWNAAIQASLRAMRVGESPLRYPPLIEDRIKSLLVDKS
jgi:hypothetical protein